MLSQRPGWEDVVPVPQDDGPNPVVTIAYTPLCKLIIINIIKSHGFTIINDMNFEILNFQSEGLWIFLELFLDLES